MGTSIMIDSDTGAPVTPPPEKSFLQKYWMYIIGIALFFAAQMGPDEPRNQNRGASGKWDFPMLHPAKIPLYPQQDIVICPLKCMTGIASELVARMACVSTGF